MESITDYTYRSILNRADSVEARRAAGIEDSITSVTRQRYASLNRNENFLGSLVETQGYLEGNSLYSVPSKTSLNGKDEVDVSNSVVYMSVCMCCMYLLYVCACVLHVCVRLYTCVYVLYAYV